MYFLRSSSWYASAAVTLPMPTDIHEVGESTRAPLLNATLVNHWWHAVAQRLIDKTIDLTICTRFRARNLRVLRRLRTQASLQTHVRHFIVRDLHTKQRVPLGLADEPPVDAWHPQEYFGDAYKPIDAWEPSLQIQLEAIQSAMTAARLVSFRWAALSPIPLSLTTSLAAIKNIEIHIKLHPSAIDTAAWSYTAVANRSVIARLHPLAANLRTLQLCVPNEDRKGRKILRALGELILICPRLEELKVHSLGRLSARSPQFATARINGPPKALAVKARCAKYNEWGTNESEISPTASMWEFWSTNAMNLGFPFSLTTLALQNFCVCDVESAVSTGVLQLPSVLTLQLSCLSLLEHFKDGLPRLRHLTMSLTEGGPRPGTQRSQAFPSASCTSFWPETKVGEILMTFDKVRTLQIFGNPEAIGETILMHLGKTLRKLVLFTREPNDRGAASHKPHVQLVNGRFEVTGFGTPLTRMSNMPSFIYSLGLTCSLLEELSCDAPNASTELDTFLEAIIVSFPRLHYLHIRRSLEPYGDCIRPNKLSHARFTESSVVAVWKSLSGRMRRLVKLKMTIGGTLSWDDKRTTTMVGPMSNARTFIVHRAASNPLGSVADVYVNSYFVTHLERVEADVALVEDRPGSLADYWQKQHFSIEEFAKPKNVPVYPQWLLQNGLETRMSCRRPSHDALGDPTYKERTEQRHRRWRDVLDAQHDAEVDEAAHPTRDYY